jgi:hypothetical protein
MDSKGQQGIFAGVARLSGRQQQNDDIGRQERLSCSGESVLWTEQGEDRQPTIVNGNSFPE